MITISSHKECIEQLKFTKDDPFAVICITNKDIPVPDEIQQGAEDVLHLEFDDVEFPHEGYVQCEEIHIKKALKFAKQYDDLCVCCHAGVSRSAALAFVIECTRVAHPKLAMGLWNKKRHHPNRHVVRLGGVVLGNPEIERCHTRWMNG